MANLKVCLPGCKATSQRALVFASIAQGARTIFGLSRGDDTQELLQALIRLGVKVNFDDNGAVLIEGCDGDLPNRTASLSCGKGGTTFRFLTALCGTQPGQYRLHADDQLWGRPHEPLWRALRGLGVVIEREGNDLLIDSLSYSPDLVDFDSSFSSQFLSSLFLVDTSRELFSDDFLNSQSSTYFLYSKDCVDSWKKSNRIEIPGDFSASLYFLAWSLFSKQLVEFYPKISLAHPESYALDYLKENFGIDTKNNTFIPKGGVKYPLEPFDVASAPDAALVIAAIAVNSGVQVEFKNEEILRYKESDRLAAIRHFYTLPKELDCCSDHRLAMAGAVLQLSTPLKLYGRECVSKSFPDFFVQWARLLELSA